MISAGSHIPPKRVAGRQVVEIAPAYGLDEGVRQRLHADAVKLAKHVGYVRRSPIGSGVANRNCCCAQPRPYQPAEIRRLVL